MQETLCKHVLSIRLGDFLMGLGHLTYAALQQALGIQKESNGEKRLGEILVEKGFIDGRDLIETLCFQLGYPHLELNFVTIDKALLKFIPLALCRQFNIVPVTPVCRGRCIELVAG